MQCIGFVSLAPVKKTISFRKVAFCTIATRHCCSCGIDHRDDTHTHLCKQESAKPFCTPPLLRGTTRQWLRLIYLSSAVRSHARTHAAHACTHTHTLVLRLVKWLRTYSYPTVWFARENTRGSKQSTRTDTSPHGW